MTTRRTGGGASLIGLVRVDGRPWNLALMKLAAWHKAQGDSVEIAMPIAAHTYDRIYRSKVFDYTFDDLSPWPCEVVSGGTGYDLTTTLPDEVEAMVPDYGIFGVPFALGFTTRGCVRGCEFCVVPRKEGRIRVVADLESFWTGQRVAKLLDNNLTAVPDHLEAIIGQSLRLKVRLDVTQGFDARLITPEIAATLRRAKWENYPHVAWDHAEDEEPVMLGIRHLLDAGFPPTKIRVYVLVGFDSTQADDLYRLGILKRLGVRPFVMPFDKSDPYQRRITRWANRPQLFMSCEFEHYS